MFGKVTMYACTTKDEEKDLIDLHNSSSILWNGIDEYIQGTIFSLIKNESHKVL